MIGAIASSLGRAETISLTPLDNAHSLISALCWRAAYNEGYGYWVVDSKLEGNPTLITVSGSEYGDGEIFMSQKGRGLGDCWGTASWLWDGTTFRKSREATTGMCPTSPRRDLGSPPWVPRLNREVNPTRPESLSATRNERAGRS
jgi:hypothetical protein